VRKPKDYKQWRTLFHHLLRELGEIHHHRYRFPGTSVATMRESYELCRRIDRVRLHLDAEFDARTTSAMQAMLETILSFGKDNHA